MVRKNSSHPSRTPLKSYTIPRLFNGRISTYLDEIRPFFLKKKSESHFWLSVRGTPMVSSAHLEYTKDFLNQVLGRALTIRDLRLNLNAQFYNSEFYQNDETSFWFNYMMDHCEMTARKYYKIYNDEAMMRDSTHHLHPFLQAISRQQQRR
jgi:hypothetical protein